MGGFFLRPKDTNLDKKHNHLNAEEIQPSNEGYEDEYTDQTGVAEHRRRHPSEASEAAPNAPSGGKVAPVSRTVPSGFGRGTRAGNTGVRRQ
jgi:hypothetical protein